MHKLSITNTNKHSTITLDEFELKDVASYELKQQAGGPTEIILKLLVETDKIKIKQASNKKMIIPLEINTRTFVGEIASKLSQTIQEGLNITDNVVKILEPVYDPNTKELLGYCDKNGKLYNTKGADVSVK